jgi:hypothetical protein
MFKVIKFRKGHIPIAKQLAEDNKKFNFPDVTSPLIVVRCSVIDDEGKIVACGFLKLISEAILVIDKNLTMNKRAEIVDTFYKVGARAAKKKGLDEINAFVTQDKSFVNFLLKRLDFKESGAEVLVKRL